MQRFSTRTSARGDARGFTLVELMTVVIIVGVLATLATYGVRRYITATKTGEAIEMLGSIKAAQEAYKAETFSYLDVGHTKTLPDSIPSDALYPSTKPGAKKTQWGGDAADTKISDAWRALGVQASAPVYYSYACAAGAANDTVATPGFTVKDWPDTVGQPWYVAKAMGDLDGDDTTSSFVSPSFSGQVFSYNEDE